MVDFCDFYKSVIKFHPKRDPSPGPPLEKNLKPLPSHQDFWPGSCLIVNGFKLLLSSHRCQTTKILLCDPPTLKWANLRDWLPIRRLKIRSLLMGWISTDKLLSNVLWRFECKRDPRCPRRDRLCQRSRLSLFCRKTKKR